MKKHEPVGQELGKIVVDYVKNNPGSTAYEIHRGTKMDYYKIRTMLPFLNKQKRTRYTEEFDGGRLVRRYFVNRP